MNYGLKRSSVLSHSEGHMGNVGLAAISLRCQAKSVSGVTIMASPVSTFRTDFLVDFRPATIAGHCGAIYQMVFVGGNRICAVAASGAGRTGRKPASLGGGQRVLPDRGRTDRAARRHPLGSRTRRGHGSLGIHPRTVWRLVASGDLPQPIRIGSKTVRWRLADLNQRTHGAAD